MSIFRANLAHDPQCGNDQRNTVTHLVMYGVALALLPEPSAWAHDEAERQRILDEQRTELRRQAALLLIDEAGAPPLLQKAKELAVKVRLALGLQGEELYPAGSGNFRCRDNGGRVATQLRYRAQSVVDGNLIAAPEMWAMAHPQEWAVIDRARELARDIATNQHIEWHITPAAARCAASIRRYTERFSDAARWTSEIYQAVISGAYDRCQHAREGIQELLDNEAYCLAVPEQAQLVENLKKMLAACPPSHHAPHGWEHEWSRAIRAAEESIKKCYEG